MFGLSSDLGRVARARWRALVALVVVHAVACGPLYTLAQATPPPGDPPPQSVLVPAAADVDPSPPPDTWTGPDLAAVLMDPLVRALDEDLRAQGFMIAPLVLDRGSSGGDHVLSLGIDNAGPKNPVATDPPMWRDALRMHVNIIWSQGRAIASVETRLGRDELQRWCFLHEARLASDPNVRMRAVDTMTPQDMERSVFLVARDAGGAFVPLELDPNADLSWNCLKNCFAAAGASITKWAAICLVGCLVAAGLGALATGGSAFLPILTFCVKKCAAFALKKVGTQLLNCIRGC